MDDLLIAGGGLIGAAAAWHCARRGMAVRVLDRGEPGGGSSPRAFGLVDVLGPHPAPYLLARRGAIRETAQWLAENGGLAAAAGWNPCGSLNPDAGPEALPELAQAGVRAQWWDRARLQAAEPALDLPGALHLPDDGCLDPAAYLDAVRAAAIRAGAGWEQAAAPALRPSAGGWDAGPRRARRVLVAAGVWSPALVPGLPVRPVRGTVLETEPLPPLLRRYTPALRQMPGGRIWIGGSAEEAGFDLSPSPAAVAALRAAGARQMPALAAAAVERVWTGLRPVPRDGLPIAGAWPGAAGLFVCVTHSGVTMAQWLGRRIAALIAGDPAAELEPFRPGRF